MLDKNVGDALLKLDLSPPTDAPTAQIERIIDADRRRVQRWTRIAIGLWILAALGAFIIFVIGGLAMHAIAEAMMKENKAQVAAGQPGAKATEAVKPIDPEKGPLDKPTTPIQMLTLLLAKCMLLGTAAFMLLVFAGLATVLLLLRSRTATFRQINANLLQISEQLKQVPPAQLGNK
jgi:hypothetical protein